MIHTLLDNYQVAYKHVDLPQGVTPLRSSVPGEHQLGLRYVAGGQWVAFTRPTPITLSVTRRQGKMALFLAGHLPNVQPAIDAITDDTERELANIYWNEAQEFERTNPVLNQLAQSLGLTQQDVDNLFTQAAGL